MLFVSLGFVAKGATSSDVSGSTQYSTGFHTGWSCDLVDEWMLNSKVILTAPLAHNGEGMTAQYSVGFSKSVAIEA